MTNEINFSRNELIVQKSLVKAVKIMNELVNMMPAYSDLKYNPDLTREISSRNMSVLEKIDEIIDYLNNAFLTKQEVDTAVLDAIKFKPYNLSKLKQDTDRYINLIKTTDNLEEFMDERKKIIDSLPEFLQDYTETIFPTKVGYVKKNYPEINTFEFDGNVQIDDGELYNLSFRSYEGLYVPTTIDNAEKIVFITDKHLLYSENEKSSYSALRKRFYYEELEQMEKDKIEGTLESKKSVSDFQAKAKVNSYIKSKDKKVKLYQTVDPIEYLSNVNNYLINDKEFIKQFMALYLEYLTSIYSKYSNALINMKMQKSGILTTKKILKK